MKEIGWSAEKNRQLIKDRNISFEDAVFCLLNDRLLDDIEHPDTDKYSNQRVFVIEIDDYAYLVPYVESESSIFLKTVIPSRKATKQYLRRENEQG